MAADSIIVLGVGNTLMQDDGVGVKVIRALFESFDWPAHVRLLDGGVAGFAWLQEIMTAKHLLIVDAMQGVEAPGTVYRLTPKDLKKRQGPTISAHEVGLSEVLGMAELMGRLPQTIILGVQASITEAPGMELTPPLQEALPAIVRAVVAELGEWGAAPVSKNLFH